MKNLKNLDRKIRNKIYFLVASVLISLFVSNSDLNYLFYINVSPVLAYIVVFVVSIVCTLYNKKIYLDIITAILFARLVLYILPITYTENMDGFFGNYFSVIASFVAYFVSSQAHNNTNYIVSQKINKILASYVILISVQVIYVFFSLLLQRGLLSINLLKLYMVTPVGASNYIACIILPLLVFVNYSDLKKRVKLCITLVGIISLFMIRSKNALFVLVIMTSVKLIKSYFRIIIKSKSDVKLIMPIIFITIFLIIFIIFVVYSILRYYTLSWNMGMELGSGSMYDTINALTSNRLFVYSREITRWKDHILFGNGLAYELGYTRSHNWIIELLVQSGIIGFVMFFTAIICWFLKIYRFRMKNSVIRASFVCVIVMLFQGMAEISLFTTGIDVLFWYFIGMSIAEANFIEKVNQDYRKREELAT